MASLDSLTDSEIRLKLSELGCPVGPVTATTRKVLLKKLKVLLDQGKHPSKGNLDYDPHSTITQFSSGEESDDASSSGKTRRRSMPPPKSAKSPRKKSPSRTGNPLANSTFTETASRRNVSVEDTVKPGTNISGRRSTRQTVGPTDFSSFRTTLDEFKTSVTESNDLLSRRSYGVGGIDGSPSRSDALRYSTNSLGRGSSDEFRSRFQNLGNNSTPQSATTPPYKSNQPYSSEFARRLTSVTSRSSISPTLTSKLLDVKESDDEDNGSVPHYAKFSHSNVKGIHNIQNRVNSYGVLSQDSWFSYDSPVSAVLVLIFLLFFLMIGATYINMHSVETNIGSNTDLKYPLCELLQNNGKSGNNCIPEDSVQIVTTMFKVVQQELYDRNLKGGCLDTFDPLTLEDIRNLVIAKESTVSVWNVDENNLNNLKVLIHVNPEWKISHSQKGIFLTDPPITLFCYIYKRVIIFANWLLKALVLLGGILLCYQGIKWWMWRSARYNDEVYKLVANILEIVSSKTQDSNSFVPISHVRDQLIPPKDRRKMSKLWNDAIAILESDSRLRCEIQQIEGEEFAVWRWLASPLNSKRKVWQGQAFETVEGSVNSLTDSPTPCLKIRHMFDPTLEEGDDWAVTVADAILEKCGDAKVLHVVVDKQSREGCVYMKCASQHDAGIAYRALQGSWFDSKLVSVKYIREKRYLERFPESSRCVEPLRPSNDNKNSLQN